jgi:hypothetical protein
MPFYFWTPDFNCAERASQLISIFDIEPARTGKHAGFSSPPVSFLGVMHPAWHDFFTRKN